MDAFWEEYQLYENSIKLIDRELDRRKGGENERIYGKRSEEKFQYVLETFSNYKRRH